MESRVAPFVRLNRFRPVVDGLSDDSGDVERRERRVLAVLVSPLVRRHAELRYYLLKKCPEILLPSSKPQQHNHICRMIHPLHGPSQATSFSYDLELGTANDEPHASESASLTTPLRN